MKILHIMAGRGQGGAETYSTDIMLSLHNAGVDQICVIAPDGPRTPELAAAGLRLATNVLSFRFRPIQKWRLKKLIEKEQPDIIHCWMRRAASLIPAQNDAHVIGWFGGYYDPSNFKHCESFIGVTQGIADHMVEKGVPSQNAHYIPTFPDVREDPIIDRTTLNTPAKAPVILALSRLHEKKGLDTLLQAAANIPNAYIWLAGEGPLRSKLEKLTQELGLKDRVRFLGWRTDRGALLRAADLCVLPSRYEPFGTVILEAWAAKTPFVAAASAGPAAHIRNEENGLIVPINNAPALAKALIRAIEDKTLCQHMINTGYAEYQEKFTREAVTTQMINFYKKILEK